jgi:phage shock protein A
MFSYLIFASLKLPIMATFVFRTSSKVSEMLGNVNTSNALSAFEKMEEKGEAFRWSESLSKSTFSYLV